MTVRGGGVPYHGLASMPIKRMGPPPRSSLPMRITASWFGSLDPPNTRLWHDIRAHTRAPLDLIPTTASLPSCSEPSRPSLAVAARLAASLDRSCARWRLEVWVGAKKRLSGRTKKLRDEKMDRTLEAPP